MLSIVWTVFITCSALLLILILPDIRPTAVHFWNSYLFGSSPSKSPFYERVTSGSVNHNPKQCATLLKHLGASKIPKTEPSGNSSPYCQRLQLLLDNCLTNQRTTRNFISQSDFANSSLRSSVDLKSSNLLFITYDSLEMLGDPTRDHFTTKLLSYFIANLQRNLNFSKVVHTPSFSCQSSISAVNLEAESEKAVIYGPATFGTHRVLSTKNNNLYILWAKHPFVQSYEHFLQLRNNFYLASSKNSRSASSETLADFHRDFQNLFIRSDVSFHDFLIYTQNMSLPIMDNPLVRSMLGCGAGLNSSEQEQGREGKRLLTDEQKAAGDALSLTDHDFLEAHKMKSIYGSELTHNFRVSQNHFDDAVKNIETYVAFVGLSHQQFSFTTDLFCQRLNLSRNCFGPIRKPLISTSSVFHHSDSEQPMKSADEMTSHHSGNSAANHNEEFDDRLSELMTSLSARDIDILSRKIMWDLKLYDYLSRRVDYQLASPLENPERYEFRQ